MSGLLPFIAIPVTNIMLSFLMTTHIIFGPSPYATSLKFSILCDPSSLMRVPNSVYPFSLSKPITALNMTPMRSATS